MRQSGYNKKLSYKLTDTKHQKHSKHKRKIIWLNPLFSKNVSTKIGKSFLSLLDLHFPRNHIYSSIFNRNKIKVSHSCMQNMKSVINYHNMNVLNNTAEIEEGCNCRNRNKCPLDGKCLTPNIIYEAQIMSNHPNYKQKVYIGTAETDFKHRFNNHTKSFNLEHYENDTELSKEYWAIKGNHFTPIVTWRLMRKSTPFNTTKRKCYLSLNEKLEIASYKGDNLLNKSLSLLTSVDTRTNLLFYGIIARTKSYAFTVIFLAAFPLEPVFSPARFMFCIMFSKTEIEQLRSTVSLENVEGNYFL